MSKPRLRLHRPAVKGPEQDSLAQFEFEADSAVYQGIRVEHPRAFGEIWIDAVRLRGAADLEGECFEYGIDLQPAWSWLTGPKLAGQFELGPVRLRAFDIPTHLTAGNPIRMSGDIEVNGGFRMVPGERPALWPQIRLGLEEMEMVAHQVIATAVDGAIGWGPLKDRGQGSDGRVQIARIGYRDHELTDVCIQVGRVADDAVTIHW